MIDSDRIRTEALDSCFDAFSSREPVSNPDQVRGRLSLENAITTVIARSAIAFSNEVDTPSREENASKQESKASVLIQSEPVTL